ncbi:MAG: TonB-dependent receptor [Bacteroidota bacterium]
MSLSRTCCLIFLSLPFITGYAQEFSVRGVVIDSTQNPITGITASLQDLQDPNIAVGAITDTEGKFDIRVSKAATYKLWIYSPGYLSYTDTLPLTFRRAGYDLGNIQLSVREFMGDSVLIEAEKPPMLILGDTVVYNVGSFQTRPNAVLEKLLEQLPGIEVNDDGSITAEGQPVQQIKIDGKEFFGNNVKLAVKNIPVEAVEKVQVTDSKTEETEFTGVNDGVQLKTINLKLRPDKRSGYFGNVAGGYGPPDDRYVGKVNAFRFSPKMQLSVLGLANNVNEIGFGGDQIQEFMGGWENMGRSNWSSNGVAIGGAGVGLPTSWGNDDGFITTQAGGINLNYDINDRTHLTTTYIYGGKNTLREESTFRENFLPDQSFITEDRNIRERRNDGHAFNLLWRQDIDSTQQLSIQTAASYSEERNENTADNRSLSNEGILQNSSLRTSENLEEGVLANLSINYRKRFRKKGRNAYLGASGGIGNDDRDQAIQSLNEFLDPNTDQYTQEDILQEQFSEGEEWNYRVYAGFNEPLSETDYLTFGFNRSQMLDENKRDAFDLDQDDQRIRNVQLSNHFERTMDQNRFNLGYRRDSDKLRIRASINGEQTQMVSDYLSEDTLLDQSFFFLLPEVDIRYTFENGWRLDLEYDTNVREPSLSQLQPFIDNTNPIRVYQGNPGLTPTYTHQMELDLRKYDRETRRNMGVSFDLDIAQDPINTQKTVDEQLRQVSMPVNVDRGLLARSRIYYNHPFKWLKSSLSISLNGNYRENTVFLNESSTDVEQYSGELTLRLRNRDREVISYYLRAGWELNQTHYVQNAAFDRQTFNHRYTANMDYNISQRLTLAYNFTYRIFAGDAFNEQQSLPILSAEVLFYPMESQQLELKLSGTDLFNRNQGINRRSTNTFLEEERVNNLARYFLLSATWKLSSLGVEAGRKKYRKGK